MYLERDNVPGWIQKEVNFENVASLFTDQIRQAMDEGKITGAVFIDLQKTFNMV